MKFIITESQIDHMCKVFENLLLTESYEGVCNVDVDYDDVFDKFVINIFFDRKFSIKAGPKISSIRHKVVNKIGQKFFDFIGRKPFIYDHYEDCE